MVDNLWIVLVQLISNARPAVHLVMKEGHPHVHACLSLHARIVLWERFLNPIMKKAQQSRKEMQ